MQSVGNDFVVIETTKWPEDTDWTQTAIRLCDRRFGIGSDGLMLLTPSKSADIGMRMFNPDGTEDMCGNGMRCVLHLAHRQSLIGNSGLIETLTGNRFFSIRDDETVRADMGFPGFAPWEIPLDPHTPAIEDFAENELVLGIVLSQGNRQITLDGIVNTGSTHTVVFVDELPTDDEFHFWSPFIENHPYFPERTSIMWTQVVAPSALRLRIWERGAGETLGCGTGACAAAVVARLTGRLEMGPTTVISRGGTLTFEWGGTEDKPSARMHLTGRAQIVYQGEISSHAEG
jgi:diaminopimelate epimerase